MTKIRKADSLKRNSVIMLKKSSLYTDVKCAVNGEPEYLLNGKYRVLGWYGDACHIKHVDLFRFHYVDIETLKLFEGVQ